MEDRLIYEHLMKSAFKVERKAYRIVDADFFDSHSTEEISCCILCALINIKNGDNACIPELNSIIDRVQENMSNSCMISSILKEIQFSV